MTTFANRERMRDRQTHIDLLEQVADSTEERDNVRRILSGAVCHGPCNQGRKACPCPDACQFPAREEDERPPLRSGDLFKVAALILAAWAATAFVLLVMGVRL